MQQSKCRKMNPARNLPELQLSFITEYRREATPAAEPNKPLERISFLIRQTLSESTAKVAPNKHWATLLTVQPTLHMILLIKDNYVHSSVYLSLWICSS